MAVTITREGLLGFRVRAQQLDRAAGPLSETAVLDAGVQDTGTDGGLWALAIRGVDVSALAGDELATVWTIRGAPHLYRRGDLPFIAHAVWPVSDADAGKRIFDASKPLKQAGIGALDALDAVAGAMRSVVTAPMVKGEVSTHVTQLMDPPYLRFCRVCDATHLYEMPFRLAALRAGLELQAGTSPPVLQPIPGFEPATQSPDRYDVVRTYLRVFGPATPKQVAEYIDSPVKEVKGRWPSDVEEVSVAGEIRWVLADDVDVLTAGPASTTRLLGPYDLFLQTKDRPLLVEDRARAKALWPVLGRPGAVLIDGEIAGTWRPRTSGSKLKLQVELWGKAPAPVRDAVKEHAQRLAEFRGSKLSDVEFAG